jgi:outer membrane protein OmpA-like peptidoglycan-associated protein
VEPSGEPRDKRPTWPEKPARDRPISGRPPTPRPHTDRPERPAPRTPTGRTPGARFPDEKPRESHSDERLPRDPVPAENPPEAPPRPVLRVAVTPASVLVFLVLMAAYSLALAWWMTRGRPTPLPAPETAPAAREPAPPAPEPAKSAADDGSSTLGLPPDHITIGGKVAFEAGSSELKPEIRTILDRMGERMRGARGRIEIRGHAGLGEGKREMIDELELSWRRARQVRDYLVKMGVDEYKIQVSVASPHRIDPTDAAARTRNVQGVEIINIAE